ncbi:hypothetical protein AB0F52_10040 [Amycolatopsis sp. NPDC024027]|uniref:hypothetical protein n=1 Tax=Amycolatopsis sp. NPDC024027 TaxID=3154327 RepID=UPI0033CD8CA0
MVQLVVDQRAAGALADMCRVAVFGRCDSTRANDRNRWAGKKVKLMTNRVMANSATPVSSRLTLRLLEATGNTPMSGYRRTDCAAWSEWRNSR